MIERYYIASLTLYCRLAPRAFHELEDQAGRTNPKTKTQQGGQTLAEESVENDHQEAGQTTDGQTDGQEDSQTEGQTLPAFYYDDDDDEADFESAAEVLPRFQTVEQFCQKK